MSDHDFQSAISKIKIPMLILDQKWHRLFALGGKPDDVKELEAKENELLKREAELKKELKDLKKVKENLMASVMSNMEGTSDLVSKKLDDDKRLLEECKERIAAAEDEQKDLPAQTSEVNKELMMATMDYCYDKLRTNSNEAEEITNWIKDVRIQLKKNVIRKHNREINNKEIYSYMHDVFGMEVLNLFDMQNGDFYIGIADDRAEAPEGSNGENGADLSNIELEDVDLDAVSKESKGSDDNNDSNED
ncbi:hypothetical protein SAMN02910298_00468 [Pseudobutyrivibrio sp. YE44]|uniref:hypothetical protein n=1 Tax=Pseudobutyrivibrio sp. YE44 TaxID=1520802 RepID=UPI00088A826A|nr:hypothetical protein [Pseudobutyrivibrio sp. YE44]SDB10035.1 hypothetical protein SAMN02910298_00468 [Pseudobutyrivibrio sp. YE44]